MITGLFFVLFGVTVLFYPKILVVLLSSLLIVFGIGLMAMSWQFRRFKSHTTSRFVNWIVKF